MGLKALFLEASYLLPIYWRRTNGFLCGSLLEMYLFPRNINSIWAGKRDLLDTSKRGHSKQRSMRYLTIKWLLIDDSLIHYLSLMYPSEQEFPRKDQRFVWIARRDLTKSDSHQWFRPVKPSQSTNLREYCCWFIAGQTEWRIRRAYERLVTIKRVNLMPYKLVQANNRLARNVRTFESKTEKPSRLKVSQPPVSNTSELLPCN